MRDEGSGANRQQMSAIQVSAFAGHQRVPHAIAILCSKAPSPLFLRRFRGKECGSVTELQAPATAMVVTKKWPTNADTWPMRDEQATTHFPHP